MSSPGQQLARHRPSEPTAVRAGVAALAAYHLALAVFMAVAPHAFFLDVGPFGARNDHYVRDVATYDAALGFAFAVSFRRASWRVPVLALATVQFALHSVNHLIDIGAAHPEWNGYFDFFSLATMTLLLGWLWHRAAHEQGASREPRA